MAGFRGALVMASLAVALCHANRSYDPPKGSFLRKRSSTFPDGVHLHGDLFNLGSRAASKMTPEEQKAIVDIHNKLRAAHNKTHQPCTAADMEAMVWDETLATEAQEYADGCIGDHADGAGSAFGENLFVQFPETKHTMKDLTGGVQAWYDEIVDTVWDIKDNKVTSKPKDQCKELSGDVCNVGHYFQVIWAKSNKIGCGVAKCSSSFMVSGSNYGSGVLMICRYQKPASLGAGQTNSLPYIFGKPCAACPDHCSNGLCTAAPTRCLDKLGGDNALTIGSTKFTSCRDLVKAHPEGSSMPWCSMLAGMMKAEDTCALSCKKCTVPSGVGAEYCGGALPVKEDDNAKEEGQDGSKASGEDKEKPDSKEDEHGGDAAKDSDKQAEGKSDAGDSEGKDEGKSDSKDQSHDDGSWGWSDEEAGGDHEGDDSWGWGDGDGDGEGEEHDDEDWGWGDGDGDGDGEEHDDEGWGWGDGDGEETGEKGEDGGMFEFNQKTRQQEGHQLNANGE